MHGYEYLIILKGSVQQKIRWVESGVFRRVWASYCGAGCYLAILGGLHLVYTFFRFRSVQPKL
jgi:hypothetical protein